MLVSRDGKLAAEMLLRRVGIAGVGEDQRAESGLSKRTSAGDGAADVRESE